MILWENEYFLTSNLSTLLCHQWKYPIVINTTVFDLISEHALISGPPPPLFFEILKKKIFFFFLRDPVIIISGPSHATIFGSSALHPG